MYNPMGNQQNIMQRFVEFRKNFKGNPQEQVQQLLNSGKVSQAQYNQAVQMANNLRKMFGI
jgi:vancomycin permeability regulator SanA